MRLSEDWYKRLVEDVEVQELIEQYKIELNRIENKVNKQSRSLKEEVYIASRGSFPTKIGTDRWYNEVLPAVEEAKAELDSGNIKTMDDLKRFRSFYNKRFRNYINFEGGIGSATAKRNVDKPVTFFDEHDLRNVAYEIEQAELDALVKQQQEDDAKLDPRTRKLLSKYNKGTITQEELEELTSLLKKRSAIDDANNTGGNVDTVNDKVKDKEQEKDGDKGGSTTPPDVTPDQEQDFDYDLETDWDKLKDLALDYWGEYAPTNDTPLGAWTRDYGTEMAVIAYNDNIVYPNASTAIKYNYVPPKDALRSGVTSEQRKAMIINATKLGHLIYRSCEGKFVNLKTKRDKPVFGHVWRYATPKEIDTAARVQKRHIGKDS